MERHVNLKHKESKEKFSCEICAKSFKLDILLKSHLLIHKNFKHKCSQCEKIFSNKRNLNAHMNSMHRNVKPFKCETCAKGFAMNSNLKTHIRRVHEKPYDFTLVKNKHAQQKIKSRNLSKGGT